MRKKGKSLRAVMLCILLVLQLFGWDNMNALAEEVKEIAEGDTLEIAEGKKLEIAEDTQADIVMNANNTTLDIVKLSTLVGNITGSSGATNRTINIRGYIMGSINVPDVNITNYGSSEIWMVNCNGDKSKVLNLETGVIDRIEISNGGVVENEGRIANVVFTGSGTFKMTGGTVQFIEAIEASDQSSVVLEAGNIGSINSDSPIKIGGDVRIDYLTCSKLIHGEGNVIVSNELDIGYNSTGESVLIVVKENTDLHFAEGAGIKVQYNGNTYTLQYNVETSGTLVQLKGNKVSVSKGANINAVETIPSREKYLCGSTSATAKYTAAEGYYFPDDYKGKIGCTGTGKLNVNCNSSTVKFTYTPAEGEVEKEITITLPDATPKQAQGEPTGVSGGTDVITGTTTAMEYAATADAAADKWKGCSAGNTTVSAGTWYVRYKGTATKLAGTPVPVRVKTEGTCSIRVDDIAYGSTLNPVVTSSTGQDYEIKYKINGADDSTYTSVQPASVGQYTAKVTFEENDTYVSIDETDDFEITKASKEKPTDVTGGVEKIIGTTTEMEYASDAAADVWEPCLEDSTPVAIGVWYVRYKETATHFAGEPVSVRVRKMGTGSISVADITYGETPNPDVKSDTYQTHEVKYKLKDADDSTYTSEKPTSVGNYIAKVTFEENDTYASTYETDDFKIIKASQGKPEGVEPEGVDAINGTTTDMEYAKSETAADGDWVACSAGKTTVSAGTWYVRYKETDTHFAGVPVAVRVKTNGSGTLQVSDVYYGGSVKPVVTSNTNKSYTVQYKKKGATEYTSDVPVEVGEYTARVTFKENDTYLSSVAYDDFVISYLPLPDEAYTISGVIGDNGYYVSAIKIVAALGYLVSDTQDGNYVQSLEYSKVPETARLFFMKQNTGEKTAGVSLPEIYIDNDLPVIDAINNNVYYGDSIEIPVSDINLKEITVNGEEYKFENGYTKLLLEANSGVSYYEIVVTDIAGNRNKIVVTVAAKWTETGVVPSGGIVRLTTNSAYKLGEGTWHVEGDSTIYSGNQTFYVGNEGEYTFNNE